MKFQIDISYISSLYDIKEDGSVFDIKRKVVVVPIVRKGYRFIRVSSLRVEVSLGYLVCLIYHGQPSTPNLEPCHLDGNKLNDKADNLAWMTRGEVVKRSYERGRRPYWKGKRKGKHSAEAKAKMALRKNKRVICDDEEYPSIEAVLPILGICRKTFNAHIASGIIKGHKVSVIGVAPLVSTRPQRSQIVITPIAVPTNEAYSLDKVEENYDVHPDGRIYSKKDSAFLKPIDTKFSVVYNIKVRWYNVQVSAGRLVAMKYVPPEAGRREVGHKDGNYYNNEASNLVWQSRSETRLKGNGPDCWWINNVKPIEL